MTNTNWWHISGNVDSGFEVTVTLPHSGLGDPQVCKYRDTQGGYGWDCDRTNYDASTVWLDGVDSFSDWAVGDTVGPTAVTLQSLTAVSQQGGLAALIAALLTAALVAATLVAATLVAALSGVWLWARRPGQAEERKA